MNTSVIPGTSTGGRGGNAGDTARGRVMGCLDSFACVIDPCAYARQGLATLVAERCGGAVLSLDTGAAYLRLPRADRVRPVSVLVLRLPTALAPLLDAVGFLGRFLSQPAQRLLAGRRTEGRVVLLTDLSSFWLYDTLRSVLPEEALLSVSVLPARARPQQVRAALMGSVPGTQLVHRALKMPTLKRPRGLSAGEINVLRLLLVNDFSIAAQARLTGVSAKTLYSQRLSAMRKLGVRTLSGLLRWGVRTQEVRL